jgi:hypothetical protein
MKFKQPIKLMANNISRQATSLPWNSKKEQLRWSAWKYTKSCSHLIRNYSMKKLKMTKNTWKTSKFSSNKTPGFIQKTYLAKLSFPRQKILSKFNSAQLKTHPFSWFNKSNQCLSLWNIRTKPINKKNQKSHSLNNFLLRNPLNQSRSNKINQNHSNFNVYLVNPFHLKPDNKALLGIYLLLGPQKILLKILSQIKTKL